MDSIPGLDKGENQEDTDLSSVPSKQANPDPNTCLGVFGLSLYTTERDLREVLSRYGPLAGVNVVYDQRTGRSRGFAFVYYERIDDSKEVCLCSLHSLRMHSQFGLMLVLLHTQH